MQAVLHWIKSDLLDTIFMCICDLSMLTNADCVTLEELKLMAGMSLEVYVIEVLSPYYFVVQPQGTELVAVMQSMG